MNFLFGVLFSIIISISFTSSVPVDEENLNEDEDPIVKYAQPDLYQGDMIYDDDGTIGDISAVGQNGDRFRWPNKTIPYELDRSFTAQERSTIQRGIQLIVAKTCLRFKVKSNERDFVFVQKGGQNSGCNSFVGRMGRGRQRLNLQAPGCIHAGTVAHEFLHAAGFHHEHSREDRDTFLQVHLENVEDRFRFAFNKERGDFYGTRYDYTSIMHYPRNAFSKNGRATMTPKGSHRGELGNRAELTASDAEGVKKMYSC